MLRVLARFNRANGKHACPIVIEVRRRAPKIKRASNGDYFGAPGTDDAPGSASKAFPLNAGWTIAHFPKGHNGPSWTVPSALSRVSAVYCDLAF